MKRMFKLWHNCTHLTCQQSNAQNSPSQASIVREPLTSKCSSGIKKRQRNQRSNSQHPLDHGKSKRVPEKCLFLLLTTPKPVTVWITTNCGKFFKRWKYQTNLSCLLRKLHIGQGATVRTRLWNNGLVPNLERSTSRLYTVTLLINLCTEYIM